MRIGLHLDVRDAPDADTIARRFASAEALGFDSLWLGQTLEHDALSVLAMAGAATGRVELGSFVVPTWPRHPAVLAQQALTVQLATGGRLCLGVGVSHAATMTRRLGIDLARPVAHAREYLQVLRPLLRGERVDHRGERYRVRTSTVVPGASAPAVVLAALGPRMLALARELADGVALWLCGPRFVEERARRALGEAPRVIASLPVCIAQDAGAARASIDAYLAKVVELPAYAKTLAAQGMHAASEIAIVGDEREVERGLATLRAAGVSELNAVCLPIAGDREAAARTRRWLGEQARTSQPG